MKSIINNFKLFVKIFYGELFNFKNPIKIRIFRIIARFKISNVFEKFYIKKRLNEKINTFENNLVNIDVQKSIPNLATDGFCLDLTLSKEALDKIINYINNKEFNFNRDENNKIKFADRYSFKDLYILNLMNPHLDDNNIKEILLNKNVVEVIKNYLGVNPILEWSQIYWSIPYKDKNGNHISPPNNEFGYHYDIDGFKFLKIFFYLTDVNENDGPHVFIKNTGKKNLFKALNRRLDENIINKKFYNQQKVIVGKKGSGFIEDTSFYHKGTAPINERGVLTCLYNISKW